MLIQLKKWVGYCSMLVGSADNLQQRKLPVVKPTKHVHPPLDMRECPNLRQRRPHACLDLTALVTRQGWTALTRLSTCRLYSNAPFIQLNPL
jgi:hypothetical protein